MQCWREVTTTRSAALRSRCRASYAPARMGASGRRAGCAHWTQQLRGSGPALLGGGCAMDAPGARTQAAHPGSSRCRPQSGGCGRIRAHAGCSHPGHSPTPVLDRASATAGLRGGQRTPQGDGAAAHGRAGFPQRLCPLGWTHLGKIIDPVVADVVLQPVSIQAELVQGVQEAAQHWNRGGGRGLC